MTARTIATVAAAAVAVYFLPTVARWASYRGQVKR